MSDLNIFSPADFLPEQHSPASPSSHETEDVAACLAADDVVDGSDVGQKDSPQDFLPEQHSPASPSSRGPEEVAIDPTLEAVAEAVATVERVIAGCQDDPGLLADADFIAALAFIRQHDPAEAFRLRDKLKRKKPSGVLLSDIEKMVRDEAGDGGSEEPQTADRLIELALELGDLSHDPERHPYFTTKAAPHQTFRVDSSAFKDFLSFAFYMRTKEERAGGIGVAASDTAFRSATVALSGIALHEGPEERVWLRVAQHQNGIIIDLGDSTRRVVEVLPTGWRILQQSPVKFLLPNSMAPLPVPVPGGDYSQLWRFANIPVEARPLVTAWHMESFRPNTPHPVLCLCGRQGCAKSSTQKRLRRLIDPNIVNLRAAPKSIEDVFVSAGVNWVASFENISHLSPAMQDALCTLATGGGFAARTLFTNSEETIIEAKRPIVINSIPPVVTAQDLMDRVIHIELPQLDAYREEETVEAEFEEAAPGIFGGLLDLMVATLARLSLVDWHPRDIRMIDFVRLGESMMTSMGGTRGEFSRLYGDNRRDSVARGLEASPVALAVRDMVDGHTGGPVVFFGTMKHLLLKLSDFKPDSEPAWPRSPKGLGDALRRQIPALASIGIEIAIHKPGRDGVTVEIRGREHREHRGQRSGSKSPGETFSSDVEVF